MSRLAYIALRHNADGTLSTVEVTDDGVEHAGEIQNASHHAHYEHGGFTYWLVTTTSSWVSFRANARGRTSLAFMVTPKDAQPVEWFEKAMSRRARIEWRTPTRGAA